MHIKKEGSPMEKDFFELEGISKYIVHHPRICSAQISYRYPSPGINSCRETEAVPQKHFFPLKSLLSALLKNHLVCS